MPSLLVHEVVLDASALLALINDEPGAEMVQAVLRRSFLSTVNLVEVRSKLVDYGPGAIAAGEAHLGLLSGIVLFTKAQAQIAADLRASTRAMGLSLGDRACLALAMDLNATVYTADRQWATLPLPCPIRLIR